MLNFIDKDLKYVLRSKWVRVSKIKEGVVTITQQIEHLNKELEIIENLMEILGLKRCRKWNDNLTRGTQYHSQASMRIWELMCWQRCWTRVEATKRVNCYVKGKLCWLQFSSCLALCSSGACRPVETPRKDVFVEGIHLPAELGLQFLKGFLLLINPANISIMIKDSVFVFTRFIYWGITVLKK